MRRQIYAISLAAILCSGGAYAQTQETQTDYQRAMNAANNASSQAFGQPQPDPNVIDSTGDPAPNGDTSTASPGTNTANSNIPNANSSANNRNGLGGIPYGANTTSTGSIGLGAYNSSPYNNSIGSASTNPYNSGGRGAVTPAFTGH